ncbi:hypothetical protein K1719_014638 [Acacia pycnantha]|nr:hypothetical protein K1719_014638 [Acacia pycnantha]
MIHVLPPDPCLLFFTVAFQTCSFFAVAFKIWSFRMEKLSLLSGWMTTTLIDFYINVVALAGDKIQASILNKSLFKHYDKDQIKGHCYFMENLEVIPNAKDYKVANHTFKLLFNSATYVKEETATIPLTGFSFLPIQEILTQTTENHTRNLFDVIGFVMSIGPLEEYHSGAEVKKKIRIILVDNRDNHIQMVLHDQCSLDFSVNDFNAMQKPIVLVAQLARIGFDKSGQPEVCSSFHATKVHLNEKFSEVAEFLACAKNLPSPTICSLTPSVESQKSTSAVHSILRNTPRIKVAEIPHQEVDKHFVVVCEFKKFETRHGWQLLLRLNYLISDDSGTASIVFFDKHASEIMKKSAAELKADILAQCAHLNFPEEALRYEFPSEIDSLIGKKMILKMKLNKYNKEHPNSSVSVTTYADCANLIDDFNEAASQVGQPSGLYHDEEEDIVFMRNATARNKDSAGAEASITLSEMFPTIELDEVSISDDVTLLPSRGSVRFLRRKLVFMVQTLLHMHLYLQRSHPPSHLSQSSRKRIEQITLSP